VQRARRVRADIRLKTLIAASTLISKNLLMQFRVRIIAHQVTKKTVRADVSRKIDVNHSTV
jgi:hypothetical protein